MGTVLKQREIDYTKPQLYKNRHDMFFVFSTGKVDNDGFEGIVIHSETKEAQVGTVRLWAKSAFESCTRTITFNFEFL
jgi:hypothetical protein